MPPNTDRPSAKQLAYLKTLAQRTATSFTYPHTTSEASREIQRLQRLPAAGRPPRREEADGGAYGTTPQADEIVGYGSSARWRHAGGQR